MRRVISNLIMICEMGAGGRIAEKGVLKLLKIFIRKQ